MRAQNVTKFIYQIYYDDHTRRALDPGFLPLDNTANERPDWFEFWVIRNFLKATKLQEDAWYGFVSPKFGLKTGLNSRMVCDFVDSIAADGDVALFPTACDQSAYFQNQFEQGEFWHPGLLDCSREFLRTIGHRVDLGALVSHSNNSVFSNYVVAKPRYWRRWLSIADPFYSFMEAADRTQMGTSYGIGQGPMKTFIQERLASYILAGDEFRSSSPEMTRYFVGLNLDAATRRLLIACDLLKERYCLTNDVGYLERFRQIRQELTVDRDAFRVVVAR